MENGMEGYVEKIGWRSTWIKTVTNNHIIVPNAKLSQTIIENYDAKGPKYGFRIPLQVAYDADLEKVEKIVLKIAREIQKSVPEADPDFKPRMRFKAFEDSGIGLLVVMQATSYRNSFRVTHHFIKKTIKAFQKEEIEIPYPKRHIYMEKIRK
jgi:small-conductance mechanosensitive channel